MHRCFFFAAFLLTTFVSRAQVDTNQFGMNKIQEGNLIATGAYTAYENTPFVPATDWLPGVLITPTGQRYAVTLLHYNADLDQPEYQLGEQVFRPKFAVRQFVLGDSTRADTRRFRNGFPATEQQTPTSFYEVLYDGKTKLLRRIKATLLDVTGYNSATKQKRFDFNDSYYVVKPGAGPVRMKRDRKSVLEALSDRVADVEGFLSREKLRFRDWDDVKKVLSFYDGL